MWCPSGSTPHVPLPAAQLASQAPLAQQAPLASQHQDHRRVWAPTGQRKNVGFQFQWDFEHRIYFGKHAEEFVSNLLYFEISRFNTTIPTNVLTRTDHV